MYWLCCFDHYVVTVVGTQHGGKTFPVSSEIELSVNHDPTRQKSYSPYIHNLHS